MLVGTEQTEFLVHKAVLTKSSDVFKSCCNGEWKEAKDKVIKLPEVAEETFKIYLHWLYTGTLIVNETVKLEDMQNKDVGIRQDTSRAYHCALVDLAIFADGHGDMAFQNDVINALAEVELKTRVSLSAANIGVLWQQLPAASKTRQFTIDRIRRVKHKWFVENKDHFVPEFVLDMMLELLNKDTCRPESWSEGISAAKVCDRYHEHSDKVPKCTSGSKPGTK